MVDTLTIIEAAAAANISRQAVWNAIKQGRLQAEKRGRDWHIARAEWERYRSGLRKSETDSPIDSPSADQETERDAGVGH